MIKESSPLITLCLSSAPRLLAGLCVAGLLLASPLAAESIFIGVAGNANFGNAAHWNPSGIPASGTDIRTDNTLLDLNFNQIRVQSSFSWGTYTHATEIGETTEPSLEWIYRGTHTINLTNMTTVAGAIPFNLGNNTDSDPESSLYGRGVVQISGDLTLNSTFIFGRHTANSHVASFDRLSVGGTTTLNSGSRFAVSRIIDKIELGNLVMNGGVLDLTIGTSSANGTVTSTTNLVTVSRLHGSTGTIRTDKANTFGLLRIDGAVDGTYDGTIINGSGVVSITQAGSSTLTLTNTNTYTGVTLVEAGTLALSSTGSIGNSAEFEVWENALLTKTGNLTLAQDVVMHVGNPGDSGRIAASAQMLLNGSDLEIIINGLQSVGSWQLFDFDTYDGNFSSVLLSGSYEGSLTSNGDLWEGTVNERDWTLDLSTGSLSVIPEPASIALLMGLVGLLVIRRKIGS